MYTGPSESLVQAFLQSLRHVTQTEWEASVSAYVSTAPSLSADLDTASTAIASFADERALSAAAADTRSALDELEWATDSREFRDAAHLAVGALLVLDDVSPDELQAAFRPFGLTSARLPFKSN